MFFKNILRCSQLICFLAKIWKNQVDFHFPRYVCDHENDCLNGEDELNCTTTTLRPTTTTTTEGPCTGFRCLSSNQCLDMNYICDNYKDCMFGEDESCCSKEQYSCPPPPGSENLGKCIKRRMICDNYTDCDGGFDEMNCTYSTTTVVSTTTTFLFRQEKKRYFINQ